MEIDPSASATHTLWSSALTAAAAIIAFFMHRLVGDVDGKADKDIVEARFSAHTQRLDAQGSALQTLLERQDDQHRQNTDRLDKILLEVSRK